MPTAELLFGTSDATPFSTDESTVKAWRQARALLESVSKVWLSTTRPDGRPHVMPVLLVWVDDAPHFTTRPTSRKGRNLARSAHCVISAANDDLDVVVEGRVARKEGEAALLRVAAAYDSKFKWRFAVRDGRIHDDSLPGSPEYAFYEVTPGTAFGYGADGLTATRWRFR
jgi:hypothetical protein